MRPPENLYHENIAGDPSRSSCSLNRCNLSPWIIGSDEFQARPLSIEIDGVRTTDASLFRRLAGLPDANERGRLFHDYVAVKFGLKERIPRPDGAKPRPVYSYLHLLRAWGVDSNGPAGAVLKAWVESRFGILATYHAGRLANDPAARDAFLIDRTRGTARAMGVFMQLDLLYTFCQDELRRRCAGEQWRVLYRGTHDPEEYTLRPDTDLDPDPRTASYRGTHMDGFHSAVRELVNQLTLKPDIEGAASGQEPGPAALFPGMVSAADLRHLKEILAACKLPFTLLPDYSETLDGATWSQYEKLQSGGTSVAAIRALGTAAASIEFGRTLAEAGTAGTVLQQRFGIPRHLLGLPIGIRETDLFLDLLARLGGGVLPEALKRERGRLVDSYIDGHKYVFDRRAIVYGEEDLVVGLASFLCEIGVRPVLCATGARNARFAEVLRAAVPEVPEETRIEPAFDFAEISEAAPGLKPDFLIGSSKGYSIARRLNVPLVRVGFPIHDRIGGQRVLHLGYRGAQEMFDRIVNALLETRQQSSPIGYSYL